MRRRLISLDSADACAMSAIVIIVNMRPPTSGSASNPAPTMRLQNMAEHGVLTLVDSLSVLIW